MRRLCVVALLLAGLVAPAAGPAFAYNWTDSLAAGSSGEAAGGSIPAAPASVSAACTSPTASKVTVTWAAVSRATGYSVYDATSAATGPYSLLTTSPVSGTSFTTAALSTGNYWFEVTASIGSNWTSVKSAASGESTVVKNTSCTQP